jgi:FKBP-type peptidyl-prolyl cis-trans isomerase
MNFMKRNTLSVFGMAVLGAFVMVLAGCTKNTGVDGCTPQDPSKEDAAMVAFMTAKGMTATKTSQGMYYQVMNEGSVSRPRNSSIIYCTYKGTLLDGTVFDEQTNYGRTGFQLSGLIQGWQIALPFIGKGGSIKMVIPSSLGYGCKGGGDKIPANTPLYFEVTIVDFF